MVILAHVNLLKSIPCFANLSLEAMELLLRSVREQSYAKGEIIIMEGETCPGLFVVKSGSVKLYRSTPEGEEQIVRVVRNGGCFECAPLFDKGPNPISAQAMEATELYFLPAESFEALMSTHPEAILPIVTILARRLRSLLNMVEDFSFRQVSARLAKLLLELGEREDKIVSPVQRLNQQQLACILGCSRQTANRSLQKLIREGIVKKRKQHLIVQDPEALRRLVHPGTGTGEKS